MDSHDKSAVTAEPALRLFFLLWGTVCAAAALVPLVVRLLEPIAVSPWEAQIAMEGIRFNAGLPLYEPRHATHLYGPLPVEAVVAEVNLPSGVPVDRAVAEALG